ncbi:MAG: exodeoxyribonuclease VII small subunit [Actinobacteria bacterium]|nr:exodeoxyribonuclease VII small subunit [Actinomycetota bacterium]NBY15294.1 exodeoxyribonuclease VII small subunit [Actinomycetota bacterium]
MTEDFANLSYEQAKAALDEVVAKIENKDLPLDEMVTLWEQGEKLAAVCEKHLQSARARLVALRPELTSE